MQVDIKELRKFYDSDLGQLASHSLVFALSGLWQEVPDERLLGLGYTNPYLDRFCPDSERCFSFMPARQGVSPWQFDGRNTAALVYDHEMPLPDACVDRILLVHMLEHAENPLETLQEVWRVLSPGGRLVVVVPNRRGLWARFEHTPFGTGRPYSASQLRQQLSDAMFSIDRWSDALHFPPVKRKSLLRFQGGLERFGRRIWPIFSGVIIAEATKRLYQGLQIEERARRRIYVPVLAPQPAVREVTLPCSGSRCNLSPGCSSILGTACP